MTWAKDASGRAVSGMIAELTKPLRDAANLALWGLAVVIPLVLALLFFLFAAFAWAERAFGPIDASLLLGAAFMAVAAVIFSIALIVRRRASSRQKRVSSLQGLSDPAVLAAGIELVRIVGVKRIVPVVALGVAILGALDSARKARS